MQQFAPDDRIGNYRVERELGATGTGTLYQVVHVVLPRRAVLKVTRASFAKQVLREACILEALRHDSIPQVFESGMLADRPRGHVWFAAEAIEGITLVERIVQRPFDPVEATLLVRDLAAILEHAHRRGVIYRGLRPDRVVMTPNRRFPLCIPDWSDARTHDAAHEIPHVPEVRDRGVSRLYVAPELLRGDAVDDRADIYALGVVAFLALAGTHPYESIDAPTRAALPAHVPHELAHLVEQMLSPDRYDRPSAAEVRGDLAWLAQALSTDVAPPLVEDVVLVDTEGVPAQAAEPAQPALPAQLPRIRRPRWTPTYTAITSDREAAVAGEIEPHQLTTRRS